MTDSVLAIVVIGTRPEAIKLGPVITEMRRRSLGDRVRVVCTGQHIDLIEPFLRSFSITPDIRLESMVRDQTLTHTTVSVLKGLEPILASLKPRWTIVQGDTTTAFAASLASHYARVPVGHVEAGLRSDDLSSPYPEEFNRRAISALASVHFAPTEAAVARLVAEGHARENVLLTGNTSVDAILHVGRTAPKPKPSKGRLILVTAHRRENHGAPLARLSETLIRITDLYDDVHILYPVHPNPNVEREVRPRLKGRPRIHLVPPMDYVPFVGAMSTAVFIVTDSGGVQEEATVLGKPVLIFRDTTERTEGVRAGVARLVGVDGDGLFDAMRELLSDAGQVAAMSSPASLYGDGRAAERIVDYLVKTPPPRI